MPEIVAVRDYLAKPIVIALAGNATLERVQSSTSSQAWIRF